MKPPSLFKCRSKRDRRDLKAASPQAHLLRVFLSALRLCVPPLPLSFFRLPYPTVSPKLDFMRMPALLIAAASALALAAPAHAKTIAVAAGEGAQGRLQEALIVAAPGDVVELGAGRFVLTDGLSLDVKGVTVRGKGMDATVLDFSGQKGAGEGLLVTSDEVTLRDFAVENTRATGSRARVRTTSSITASA